MSDHLKTDCHSCERETNHTVLAKERVNIIFPEDVKENIAEYEDYLMVRCNGCDFISFMIRHSGSFVIGQEMPEHYYDEKFPDRQLHDFIFLSYDNLNRLPRQIAALYEEVQTAFENEIGFLAGVGLRMLVEAICNHQEINGKDLKAKIQNLHSKGLISLNEISILDKLRMIGNQSAHKIKKIAIGKLSIALDIINHTLVSIYVLPVANKQLKLETIKRVKKLKPGNNTKLLEANVSVPGTLGQID
jgi:hypothetical protein